MNAGGSPQVNRIAQQVRHQPAQTQHIADLMAFNHVAQHRHIHVIAQQLAV